MFPVRPGDVSRAEGIAVQGGAVKGGLVHGGGHVVGQRAVQSLKSRQHFNAQGGQPLGHSFYRLLQREIGEHGQHPLPKGQMG